MEMNRRMLLSASAACALSLSLAGCGNVDWTQVQAAWNKFVDDVTAQVAAGCSKVAGFIPTVETVASMVAALFGPAAQASVVGISGAVNAVAQSLCSAMPANPPAQLTAALEASTETKPVQINTINVLPISGGGNKPTPVVVVGYNKRFVNQRSNYGDAKKLYEKHRPQANRIYSHAFSDNARRELDSKIQGK